MVKLLVSKIHAVRGPVATVVELAGLGCIGYGGYQLAPFVGWAVTGVVLMVAASLLDHAAEDEDGEA